MVSKTKKLRLKPGIDLAAVSVAPFLVRLLMCADALRAANRWLHSVPKDDSPENQTDRIISLVVVAGWAAESLRLLKNDGVKPGLVDVGMLEDHQDRLLWEKYVSGEPSETVKLLHRLRDKYLAHRDPMVGVKAVETLCALAERGEPLNLAEMSVPGGFRTTRYPWAALAFSLEFFNVPLDNAGVRAKLREVGKAIGEITNLVHNLVVAISKKHGLECELVPEVDS